MKKNNRLMKFLNTNPKEFFSRFIKWFVVGGTCTVVDIFLFKYLYGEWRTVLLANLVDSILVVSFGYLANHYWAFKSTRNLKSAAPRFLINLGLIYFLNTLLVWSYLKLGLSPVWSKIFAIPIQAPITFLVLNFWVFHHHKKSEAEGKVTVTSPSS